MRRLCLILLVTALSLPAAAIGADRASGDGSLAISGASGTVIVQGYGGLIFGQIDQGTVLVVDYKPDDPTSVLSVAGAKPKSIPGATAYSGSNLRFLLPAGHYVVELIGTGIDASAVGKGIVGATGFGTPDDGSLAVNGGKPQPLTKVNTSLAFGAKSA
jgi:hypothetical protein